jgi:hypothetical protein
LTFAAGSNMTITTNASTDTITFSASTSGGTQNLFETISVAGQTSVQADSSTDTLTFVAGTNMTITTDATTDSITFNASGGGGSFDGTATNTVSSGKLVFNDGSNGGGGSAYFGTGEDVQFYDNGSTMYMDFDAGHDLLMREGTTTRFTFDTGTGQLTATDFNSTSDESLKENVETIENALAKVINMRGVTYNWKENAQPGTGVIAQEVEQVIPQVITENDDGIKHVQYGNLVGVLIEAIKEQQSQIEELRELAHPPVAPGGTTEIMEIIRDIEFRLDNLEG